MRFDVVRNHLSWSASIISREGAIQIPAVDGRNSPAGVHSGGIRCRQHDDLTTKVLGRQAAGELADQDLPFVLVAVATPHDQEARAVAILDRNDGSRDPAEWRALRRRRHTHKTTNASIPIE